LGTDAETSSASHLKPHNGLSVISEQQWQKWQ